jgi:hypothetical protein
VVDIVNFNIFASKISSNIKTLAKYIIAGGVKVYSIKPRTFSFVSYIIGRKLVPLVWLHIFNKGRHIPELSETYLGAPLLAITQLLVFLHDILLCGS